MAEKSFSTLPSTLQYSRLNELAAIEQRELTKIAERSSRCAQTTQFKLEEIQVIKLKLSRPSRNLHDFLSKHSACMQYMHCF